MKAAILDANTVGNDLDLTFFNNIVKTDIYPSTTPDKVIERTKDYDIIVTNKIKLTKDVLKNLPKLKLVCVTATGYDNVDIDYAKKNNIAVCNVPAYSTDSVSQVTVAMALYFATNLGAYRNTTVSKEYQNGSKFNILTPVFYELKGKTWGIIGYGNIGKQVGKIAECLGCNVIAYKRNQKNEEKCVSLETLLKTSDIISIHTPLNDESKNMIDKNALSLMKENVILINVARGPVINENDLYEAVINKKIGAVGLDVFETEPLPVNSPLSKIAHLDNVCLTPHMAWGAYESRKRCVDTVYENIASFLKGEHKNRVDLL